MNKGKNERISATILRKRIPGICNCVKCGVELIYVTKPHKKCWECKSKEIVDKRK